MNQGKRYLRNTVLTLYGAAALFVGLNRLYAATLDTQTPQWLRSTLALGLTAHPKSEPPPQLSPADLAALRDFTRLNVSGRFDVEVVGAATYKVTFTPAAGSTMQLRAWQKDDLLGLSGNDDEEDDGGTASKGVLRIETPALTRLYVQGAPQLTLSGLQAEEVALTVNNVTAVRLQKNQVGHWKMRSGEPLEVQVDKATLLAGSLRTQGELTIRYRD